MLLVARARTHSILFVITAVPFLWVPLGCGNLTNEEYKLIRWPEGTNDRYAVEIARRKGGDVVIPDVRALQITNEFVSGNAYWKYIDGFYTTSNGSLITNEFWFVLDKHKSYPKCYVTTSTNKESWIAWCASHNVSTNIVEIKEFLASRAVSGRGAAPQL